MHLEYIPLKRGRTCGSRTQNDILNPLIYELYLLACTYCPSRLLSALNFFHCEMHFFKAAFLSKSLRKWIQTWLYVFPHFWMAVYLALGFRVDSYFFQSFETAFHCFMAPAAAAEKSTDGLFAVPGINLFFFFFFHDDTRISLYYLWELVIHQDGDSSFLSAEMFPVWVSSDVSSSHSLCYLSSS